MLAVPLAIGAAAAGAGAAAGVAAAATTGLFLGIGAWGWTAVAVGLSVLGTVAQMMLSPTPPKPQMQEGDASIKQAIPPRVRVYGRQRMGGAFLYYDSTSEGDLKTLICHAAHEIDGYEEDWLNDERVQTDSEGQVTDDPWWQGNDDPIFGDPSDGHSTVTILHYLGSPNQTIDSFDEKWTEAHRGRGLNCTYVKYSDLKDEDQIKVFPSGPPPYRAVLRGAKVYDPRNGAMAPGNEATYAYSDNSALVILDFLTRKENGVPVGFGIPWSRINLDSFAFAAAVCDQNISLKAGGAERRWRAWGAYELTEDRKDVLQDLLDGCGGRLTQGPDGTIGLAVGAGTTNGAAAVGMPAPTVVIDDDQLYGWDLTNGKTGLERINEVRATYVSEIWSWAETEAGIQLDQAGIDRNGIESSQVKLRFVPAESQAQRIAREMLRRGSPTWIGKIRTTIAGLDAWGERWIRLQIAELEIDGIFEVGSIRLDRETMMVEIDVSSYDGWWDWTTATDEADPAIPPPDLDEDANIPVPQNVFVVIENRLINGNTYAAVGVISWDPPPRPVYVGRAIYRPVTTPESPWQPLPVAQEANTVKTDPLVDGQGYEARVRFIAPRGAGGDWSPAAPFTAIADPVVPDAPILTSGEIVGSTVELETTAANNPNVAALRFWRDTDSVFTGAVDISGPLYTAPNAVAHWVDTPGPGRFYYWATAENWSGLRSPPSGPAGPFDFVPAVPVITSPTSPFVTNDNTPTFSGTGQDGTTIHLFEGPTDKGSAPVVGGVWSITSSTMADGTRNVTARAFAGPLVSAASNIIVTTIDTTVSAPIITTSSPLTTTDTTPDISGTSEPNASIALFRGGSTPAGSTVANGAGVWTATLSALAVGPYSITATQTDSAGNTSGPSAALTLNIQPVAPTITTGSFTTYDTTPVIAGTSTASASIKIYDDGVLSTTLTADGSGNWSGPTAVLSSGANTITATQTVAGVESPQSSGITVTVTAMDSAAAAYIAAMTVEPTSARMGLINDLVVALKAAGVWSKLDCLYLLAAHDAQAARLNVKSPAAFALVANGMPIYTTDRGYKGTGLGSTPGGYLAGGFNPSTAGGVYAQNSAHMGVWVRTANTSVAAGTGGDIGTVGAAIYTKHPTAGNITTQINDGTASNTAGGTPNNVGHYAISRTVNTGYAKYHEGVAQASSSVVSTAVPNFIFSILRTGATSYSDAEICAAHWGSGLTAGEVTSLYNALHTYLQGVGAVA